MCMDEIHNVYYFGNSTMIGLVEMVTNCIFRIFAVGIINMSLEAVHKLSLVLLIYWIRETLQVMQYIALVFLFVFVLFF